MRKLILVFLLLASPAIANIFETVTIEDSNIDAQGNYFVVAKAPIGTSAITTVGTQITVQCRPVMDHYSSTYNEPWPTLFWGYFEHGADSTPFLKTRTSSVDSLGYSWGTFIGQVDLKDTSYCFNDTSIIEWKVGFMSGAAWAGEDTTRSVWYFLDSDIVTPNPGAEVTLEANELPAVAGFIVFSEQYNAGYYAIKVEYYDDNSTTWKSFPNQAGNDWGTVVIGCSTLFSFYTWDYRAIYTDGQTRITFRDIDNNEAGPFAGPNILGLDGIDGTGP